MSANVIEFSQYQKAQDEENEFVAGYQQLRELMVSLFGPLEHVPEAPEEDFVVSV